MVLQGKSRSVIIRELQRTNLDVNLAVNNLLSRDDEDGDDGDDTASESYLPGGEAHQHCPLSYKLICRLFPRTTRSCRRPDVAPVPLTPQQIAVSTIFVSIQ